MEKIAPNKRESKGVAVMAAESGAPLVIMRAGAPITTTLAMALGTENEHASVIGLVRKHLKDFEEFGLVRFEIEPKAAGKRGGGDIEFAILNEDQATLLITYMRNSPLIRGFKIRLIKAFRALVEQARANAFSAPQTLVEALRLALDLEEQRATLSCQVDAQAADIAVLEPMAAAAHAITQAQDTQTFDQAAKVLGTGPNRLFTILRTWRWIKPGKTLPYQDQLDNGNFVVRESIFTDKHNRDRLFAKTLITGKGLIAIQKRLATEAGAALFRPQHRA